MDGYAQLDFSIPAENLYNWVWNIFAAHYIELVKSRAYGEEEIPSESIKSARFSLHTSLKSILKLLAPIIPFVTESIYQSLYDPETSIHLSRFPKSISESNKEIEITEELLDFNSLIWKSKKDQGLSLREAVSLAFIPESLKEFEEDLRIMHNIEELKTGEVDRSISGLIQKDNFGLKL